MILENRYNYLKGYSFESDNFFNTYGHCKSELTFDSKLFTMLSLKGLFSDDIADIDFKLVDNLGLELDLKLLSTADQFVKYTDIEGNVYAIFKGTKQLTVSIPEGVYTLVVSDSSESITSDVFNVEDTDFQNIVKSTKFIFDKPETSSDIGYVLNISATETCVVNVDWGDGNTDILVLGVAIIPTSNVYLASAISKYEIEITGDIDKIDYLKAYHDTSDTPTGYINSDIDSIVDIKNLTSLTSIDLSLEMSIFPFAECNSLTELYFRRDPSFRGITDFRNLSKHKDTLVKFYSNFNLKLAQNFDSEIRECINLTHISLIGSGLSSLPYANSSGELFNSIKEFNISNSSFTVMPYIGLGLEDTTVLTNYNVSSNRIYTIENISDIEAEFEPFFGNSLVKTYDFRSNLLSVSSIDLLLKYASVYGGVTATANLTLKLEGASSLGANATPTNDVVIVAINSGGSSFVVGETLTNGSVILTVTSVSTGVITGIEITNGGSGNVTVVDSWTASASGVSEDVDAWSYFAKLVDGGATITTN